MKLTSELAYLPGLFTGRGKLIEDNGTLLLEIFFPFTALEEETFSTLSLFASTLPETFTSRLRRLPDTSAVSVEEDFRDKGACLELFFPSIDADYSSYTVPVMSSGRRVFQELAGENRRHPEYLSFVYKFCERGSSRSSRRKRPSPLEESEKLPA